MAGPAGGELVALHGELADKLGQSAVVGVTAGDQPQRGDRELRLVVPVGVQGAVAVVPATGLATMTQQIGITMGTPIMSALATAAMTGTGASAVLGGLKTAIAVNAALVLLGAVTSAVFLRGARSRPEGAVLST